MMPPSNPPARTRRLRLLISHPVSRLSPFSPASPTVGRWTASDGRRTHSGSHCGLRSSPARTACLPPRPASRSRSMSSIPPWESCCCLIPLGMSGAAR
nr:MAG TPA: hypothetical protein [Caudoviricetes sp.]